MKRICLIVGCSKEAVTRGMCRAHYESKRRVGLIAKSPPKTTYDKFFARVEKSSDCWIWKGQKREGYGRLKIDGHFVGAHRISYEIHFGEFSKNLCVLHRCDNPSCVNPDHLFLGSHEDNMKDMAKKGRGKSGRYSGQKHAVCKLTESDVLSIRCDQRTQDVIAADYGVSRNSIYKVKARRTWTNV